MQGQFCCKKQNTNTLCVAETYLVASYAGIKGSFI